MAPCVVPTICTVAPVSGSRVCLSVMEPLIVPAMTVMTESVRNKIRKKIFPKSNFVLISFMRFLIRCKDAPNVFQEWYIRYTFYFRLY